MYRQQSDGIDGKLIILGVPHGCDMIVVYRLWSLLGYEEKAIGCRC